MLFHDWPCMIAYKITEPTQSRKKHKIYIPNNPEINFFGLLIGPRGSNQKRLEESSGARILIRGNSNIGD